MIVLDASITAPAVLPDEPAWPAWLGEALTSDDLIVPSLWPAEVMSFLHNAEKRGRIDRAARTTAIGYLQAMGVTIMPYPGGRVWRMVSRLADDHGLTIYDAAYLDLAIDQSAVLASLDGDLLKAARAVGLQTLSY